MYVDICAKRLHVDASRRTGANAAAIRTAPFCFSNYGITCGHDTLLAAAASLPDQTRSICKLEKDSSGQEANMRLDPRSPISSMPVQATIDHGLMKIF